MKFKLTLLLCIIIAVILGALLGGVCADSANPYIHWLGLGKSFGFDTIAIDLHVLKFSFGMHVDINVTQILFIILAIVVSPKIAAAIKTS